MSYIGMYLIDSLYKFYLVATFDIKLSVCQYREVTYGLHNMVIFCLLLFHSLKGMARPCQLEYSMVLLLSSSPQPIQQVYTHAYEIIFAFHQASP